MVISRRDLIKTAVMAVMLRSCSSGCSCALSRATVSKQNELISTMTGFSSPASRRRFVPRVTAVILPPLRSLSLRASEWVRSPGGQQAITAFIRAWALRSSNFTANHLLDTERL